MESSDLQLKGKKTRKKMLKNNLAKNKDIPDNCFTIKVYSCSSLKDII
jgi:hypothetical protein